MRKIAYPLIMTVMLAHIALLLAAYFSVADHADIFYLIQERHYRRR